MQLYITKLNKSFNKNKVAAATTIVLYSNVKAVNSTNGNAKYRYSNLSKLIDTDIRKICFKLSIYDTSWART